MNYVFQTLVNTPLWVWGILAFLLFIGLKATKSKILHPTRLFFMPMIFMVINSKLTLMDSDFDCYMICLTIGMLVGFIIGLKTSIKIFRDLKLIELPGNYYTIALLLLFFICKYTLGYLKATKPFMIPEYTFIDSLISGLLSGYFLGLAACYLTRYYLVKQSNI